VTSHM